MSRLSVGYASEGRQRESATGNSLPQAARLSFQCPTHGDVRSLCHGTRIATTGSLMRVA